MGPNIRTLVGEERVRQSADEAVGVDCRAQAMNLIPRVIGGHQVFPPILDPFDWQAKPQSSGADQHILGIKLTTDAKSAADMAFAQANTLRRQAEHPGNRVTIVMRDFRRSVHREHRRR